MQRLTDRNGNEIGQVAVEGKEGDTFIGRFTPGPAYPEVEPLFREFAEAVESQALSRVDRLDTEIARLGLCLSQPSGADPIRDVQLWDGERITYRIDRRDERKEPLTVPSRRRKPVAVGECGSLSASESSSSNEGPS